MGLLTIYVPEGQDRINLELPGKKVAYLHARAAEQGYKTDTILNGQAL